MVINNDMYRVAEFTVPGMDDHFKLTTVQDAITRELRGINPDVVLQRDNGSNTIGVYILKQHIDFQFGPILDPIATKLEEFKEKQGRIGTSVELTIYDLGYVLQQNYRDREVSNLRESVRGLRIEGGESTKTIETLRTQNELLQRRYTQAEIANEPLNTQLGEVRAALRAAETEVTRSSKYASGLEEEVNSLKEDALHVSATSGSLIGMMQSNEQLYFKAQEGVIAEAYNLVSADIDNREFYEKMEEVNEARKTIGQRNKYLADHGEEALELLPQVAREATLKEWEGAEQIVAAYEQYQEGITPLDVPIRIAKTDGGITIVLPVNPKSANEVARSLYDNLVTYSAELQSEFGLEASVDDKQPFATLNITGELDHSTIEDRLKSSFGEVAEQAKLNLQPFSFNYFESSLDQKSPVLEAVNPREYVHSRIIELGYTGPRQFISEKRIKGFNTALYRLSRGDRIRGKTIENLATALEIPSSDLHTVIDNWQRTLAKSTATEIENPRDYIQSIIRELGYPSQISFSNEKGISGFRNTLFKLSNGAGLENRTLDTLATALGINRSKLEEVIKNYQSSLSENVSAEPEIVSSVPAKVIDTPEELIPAAERVNSGADYLISKVTEQFGSQKEFDVGTGMRIGYSISRLKSGHELTDELIRKIAKHLPGLRWDTLRRNLRP